MKKGVPKVDKEVRPTTGGRRGGSESQMHRFTTEFARMVSEGQSLMFTLTTLQEQHAGEPLGTVIGEVTKLVEEGHVLSRAMARSPDLLR